MIVFTSDDILYYEFFTIDTCAEGDNHSLAVFVSVAFTNPVSFSEL